MGFKIKIKLLPALFIHGNTMLKVVTLCNIFRYTVVSLDGSLSPFLNRRLEGDEWGRVTWVKH